MSHIEIGNCPNHILHGNPFRYCTCGWTEGPRPDADPRTELGDRITAKIHDADCGCSSRVHPQDQWDYYGRLTDAVMELFVDVRCSEWLRAGYVIAELAEPQPSTESETPQP